MVTRQLLTGAGLISVSAVVPMAIGLVSIPSLLSLLGPVKFGLLALFWAIATYAPLLDFGLAKELTRQLAASPSQSLSRREVIRATSIGAGLGLLVGALAAAVVVSTTGSFRDLDLGTFSWISASVIISTTILTTIAMGVPLAVLEARRSFAAVALVRTTSSVLSIAGPVVVAMITTDLILVSLAIPGSRIVGLLLALFSVHLRNGMVDADRLSKSGWMPGIFNVMVEGRYIGLGAIAGALILGADRVILMRFDSIQLASYATVFEPLSRLLVLPVAFASVSFPLLSSRQQSYQRRNSQLFLPTFLFQPILLVLMALVPELLTAWLGSDGLALVRICLVLLVGIGTMGATHQVFSALLATGVARTVAIIQWAEFVPYVVGASLLASSLGALGMALAWTTRAAFDTLLIGYVAFRQGLVSASQFAATLLVPIVSAAFIGLLWNEPLVLRLLAAMLAGAFVVALLGTWALSTGEDNERSVEARN